MLTTIRATTAQVSTPGIDLTNFKAGHAAILSMKLSGQADGLTIDIRYEPGHFAVTTQAHSGPTTAPRDMSNDEIAGLRSALEGDAPQTVPGADIAALQAFTRYLSQSTAVAQPSGRFDNVTFLGIHKDDDGVLVGSMRIGIDVVGLIRDEDGVVTVATQVIVMRRPGPFEHLSRADRLSLAIALEKFVASSQPNPDPSWLQVLSDLNA